MNHNLQRVESATVVETIAAANHAPFTHTTYAACVQIGAVVYFWAAA